MRLALAWLGLQSRWRAAVDSSGIGLTDLAPHAIPVVDVGYDASDDDLQDVVEIARSADAGASSYVALAPRENATLWIESVRITSATGGLVTGLMRPRTHLGASFSLPESASLRLPAHAGPVEVAAGVTIGLPIGAAWTLDLQMPLRFLVPKGFAVYWVTNSANNSIAMLATVRARYA